MEQLMELSTGQSTGLTMENSMVCPTVGGTVGGSLEYRVGQLMRKSSELDMNDDPIIVEGGG